MFIPQGASWPRAVAGTPVLVGRVPHMWFFIKTSIYSSGVSWPRAVVGTPVRVDRVAHMWPFINTFIYSSGGPGHARLLVRPSLWAETLIRGPLL